MSTQWFVLNTSLREGIFIIIIFIKQSTEGLYAEIQCDSWSHEGKFRPSVDSDCVEYTTVLDCHQKLPQDQEDLAPEIKGITKYCTCIKLLLGLGI